MTDQPTDHRAEAEKYLRWSAGAAHDPTDPDLDLATVEAFIGIGHALLAQDRDRCTATRGHANGHAFPPEQPAATSSVD